jgi:hypothetical protein
VDETVTLVLADGSAAVISIAAARAIVDRLWDMGLTPGAVTAATRILDAVSARPVLRGRVEFSAREDTPLRQAADRSVKWAPAAT